MVLLVVLLVIVQTGTDSGSVASKLGLASLSQSNRKKQYEIYQIISFIS